MYATPINNNSENKQKRNTFNSTDGFGKKSSLLINN